MIHPKALSLLKCTACGHPDLRLGNRRRPDLECQQCETRFPIVEGIPDMVVPDEIPSVGNYRTETLENVIAGVYDFVAPVLSMAIWRCSPLRFVDHENRALGRAQGGVYLEAPVGTGVALGPVIAPHHDALIIGVDKSWNMLFKAQKRLRRSRGQVQLIRADYHNLPLQDRSITSLQSLNGLHGFPDRTGALAEFRRCLDEEGFFSGTALVRAKTDVADAVVLRYERYGIYPMLRCPEFLLQQMRSSDFQNLHFETHGAVMFFTGTRGDPSPSAEAAAGLN